MGRAPIILIRFFFFSLDNPPTTRVEHCICGFSFLLCVNNLISIAMSALTLSVTDYFSVAPQQAGSENISRIPTTNSPFSNTSLAAKNVPLAVFQTVPASSEDFVIVPDAFTSTPNLPLTQAQNACVPRVLPAASTAAEVKTDTTKAAKEAAERPLLRKLKLSLKLGLQRLYSATSISPKSVRFASRLENVKMFDGRDSPAAVSLVNSPVGSPKHHFFDLDDYFSYKHGTFGDIFSDSEDELELGLDSNWKYTIRSLDFVAPRSIYDKMDTPVYLQKCNLLKNGQLLILTIMCKNLAFEKRISAKVSFNNWESHVLYLNYSYVKSFATSGFDQFQCIVPLEHLSPFVKMQLCIEYSVCGQTFWENNGGKNFNISLEKQTVAPKNTLDSFTYRTPTFEFYSGPDTTLTKNLSFGNVSHFSIAPQKKVSTAEPTPRLITPPSSTASEAITELKLTNIVRPKLHHSSSEPCLKPRYSRSFRAKQQIIADAESGDKSPERKFEDAIFNSSTYTALLQRYCFNGASETPTVPHAASGGITNPFSTSGSDFHSAGDSIYI